MSALRKAGLVLGLTLVLLGPGAASAGAEPALTVDLARDSAPTSTPVTHSDERALYRVTVKNTAGGNPNAGDTLTCENSISAWFNVDSESDFTYQWLRSGATIPGATAKTYLTTAADEGEGIQCAVTGTNPSTGVTQTRGTATVSSGSSALTAVTTNFGSFTVGQEVQGFGIPVGTTIVAVGAGTLQLSATATASAPGVTLTGFTSKVSTSAVAVSLPPVVVNPQPATLPPAPINDPKKVKSHPRVLSSPGGFEGSFIAGEKLICKAPTNWTPGATFTYQWLRNGTPIPGATASEYTPVEAEDKTAVLQCQVDAQGGSGVPPAGGKAVSVSENIKWYVSFFVVEEAPNSDGSLASKPTIGFANTTSGPVSVGVELPAGQETYALVAKVGTAKPTWACTRQPPTPSQHARVDCSREDPLAPGASYPPFEIIAHIGHDAPDALVAKASLSGGGSAPASDEDEAPALLPAVPFGFKAFSTKLADSLGGDFTRAGGHPSSAAAKLEFNEHVPALPGNTGFRATNGFVKEVITKLPQGFFGNPRAVAETCPEVGDVAEGTCPVGSLIGGVTVETEFATFKNLPVYSVEPERGTVAEFAFGMQEPDLAYVITPKLHAADNYAVSVITAPIAKGPELFGASVTLCGFGAEFQATPPEFKGCLQDGGPGSSPVPFLTNPTRCSPTPPTTVIAANSWEDPEHFSEAESANPPLSGCDEVSFEPEASMAPTTARADSATGLDVELTMPTEGLQRPSGIAQANLARSLVTLPKGMTVNPTAAEGLGACTSAQIGIGNDEPPACPPSSKVGTLEVQTPLLEEALKGSVYVAKQKDNPFGSLLALYLVIESERYGLTIKVPGKISTDPVSHQLTTSFAEVPEAPFERLSLHLNSGERAPLLTPPKCGTYAIRSELSPWSATDPNSPTAEETVVQESRFKVNRGPGGAPCPPGNLEPKLKAALASPTAGAKSPFLLSLSREDGTQRFTGVSVTNPKGLTAYLKGVGTCPESSLAKISPAEETGRSEIANPSCPASSLVGTVEAGSGAGLPFYVKTGRAYLAGPYKGAPISLAIVTPAVAGPFDLGSVLVRTPLYVDPETAQVTAVSDPIPTEVHDIALDVRDIRVALDRPGFTAAPTNCEPMSVDARVSGEGGATAAVSNRFQVGGCEALAFKPKLTMRLFGGTKRGAHPRLKATLKARPGDANIAGASVALPHSEFLDQAHIGTVCTRVQFAAKSCPAASVYGKAEAVTPLLDAPVSGPVYLRSSSHQLPDLVAALRGPDNQPIEVVLAGRVDSINGGIRSSFEAVPDQPVSSFTLSMRGGKKGLLINSRDICKAKARVTAEFTAQNGAEANLRPLLQNSSCKKARKGTKHEHGH